MDETMRDFAMKYGTPIDVVEAVVGDDMSVGIEDFDPSNETERILMGLDTMMPTPTDEEHPDSEEF